MNIDIGIAKRVIKTYVASKKKLILYAFICMILAAGCNLFITKLVKPMIDNIFIQKNISSLFFVATGFFFVFLFKGLFNYGEEFFLDKLGQKIILDIQFDVFKKIIKFNMDFFNKNHSGDIISRLTNDISQVQRVLDETIINLGRNLFTIIFLVIFVFVEDFWLSMLSFSIFPLAYFFVAKISKKIKSLSQNTQTELGKWTAFLTEDFKSIQLIKSSVTEDYEITKARSILDKIYSLNFKAIQAKTLIHPIMEGVSGLSIAICLIFGGLYVIHGNSTTGAFFQFIAAFILAYKPAKDIAKLNTQIQTGIVSAKRIFDIIDHKNDLVEIENPSTPEILEGSIEFSSVSFKYPGTEEIVLNNANFFINPNKITLIRGKSGSGKSTIINLLLRFYDVNSGKITVDGYDIKTLSLKSLRKNISLVSQNIFLFNDTIKNNLKYGIENVTEEEIFEAAKKANIDSFIQTLKNGYETIIGENGINLSGGQKQRIAIARAFLKKSPILIFDEPTSALDEGNSNFISNAIQSCAQQKTVIIITHEQNMFTYADKIIEFTKSGEIITKIISQSQDEDLNHE